MKHLNLLLLTCLSCTGLIYGMEEETSSIGFSYRSKPKKLTSLVGNSQEDRINCGELDLSSTTMEYVNLENVLSIFPNLKTLKAVGCGIKKIAPITTPNNTLKNIDFSDNQFEKWQMNLVAKAVALKQLNLSSNKINEISLKGAQEGLSLNLRNNDIWEIDLEQVGYGKPLKNIDLCYNKITTTVYQELKKEAPLYQNEKRFMNRATNLVIAGGTGMLTTLIGLYCSYVGEQALRDYFGTHGTERRDRITIFAFTVGSFAAGAGVAKATYDGLNKLYDKKYKLHHLEYVKEVFLNPQQDGHNN